MRLEVTAGDLRADALSHPKHKVLRLPVRRNGMKRMMLWAMVSLAVVIAVAPAFAEPRAAARSNRVRNEYQRQMDSFRETLAEMQESINDLTWELAKQSAQMDEVFDSMSQAQATVMTAPSVSRRRDAGEEAAVSVGPARERARQRVALFAEDAAAQLDRAARTARTEVERKRLGATQQEMKALEEQAAVMKQRAARERGLAPQAPQPRQRRQETAPAPSAPAQVRRKAPKSEDTEITITITIKAPGANVSVAGG